MFKNHTVSLSYSRLWSLIQPEQLNGLNVIHITGTKGKGSTCAFCDSILRVALPGKKIGESKNKSTLTESLMSHFLTGLYTSPHIVAVRERIRINGTPISEDEFTKYFFEVWDLLEKNPSVSYLLRAAHLSRLTFLPKKRALPSTPLRPNYFRFMTIVAFHAFLSLNVNLTSKPWLCFSPTKQNLLGGCHHIGSWNWRSLR